MAIVVPPTIAYPARFVYLAGPITGLSYGETVDWRKEVSGLFLPGIVGVSPMRMKDWASGLRRIKDTKQYAATADVADFLVSGESHAINTRDMFDVREADMLFVYLPKAAKEKAGISVGTVKEVGYAAAHRKPMVLVTDDKAVGGHPLMREDIGWVVPSLELGASVVNSVLGVYVGA